MSSNVMRWGGLAALVSGVLVAVPGLLHPDESNPSAYSDPIWGPVHVLIGLGALLGLLGLIAIYNRLATHTLALPGFVLAFSGTAVFVGALMTLEAFVVPAIAASSAKALLDPNGALFTGPLSMIFLVVGLAFSVGFILLAVANWSVNALPRWAGVLSAVGAVLLAFAPPLPYIAGLVGSALFGIGIAWYGYAIWSQK